MINQGSNSPIQITFDEDMRNMSDWSIALFGNEKIGRPEKLLKHWGKDDLQFNEDGTVVSVPLTEDETMCFPPCVASLEIKWLPADSHVFLTDVIRIRISKRSDKTKLVACGSA